MNNEEILSVAKNLGWCKDYFEDDHAQIVLFYHYMNKMVELGFFEGGHGETEVGKKLSEFLISHDYKLNIDTMNNYILSDVEQFASMVFYSEQIVSTILELHTKGEDYIVNKMIDLSRNSTKEERDEAYAEHVARVNQLKTDMLP